MRDSPRSWCVMRFAEPLSVCTHRVSLDVLKHPAVDIAPRLQHIAVREEEGDLPLGALRGVGAVDEIAARLQPEVGADRTGRGLVAA